MFTYNPESSSFKEAHGATRALDGRWRQAEVQVCIFRRDAAAGRAHDVALLDQEGLDHVLNGAALLAKRLDPAVFDEAVVREFFARFGPFDPAAVAVALDAMFAHGARADQHPSVLLETLRQRLRGGEP
jgi:hypothetical protein